MAENYIFNVDLKRKIIKEKIIGMWKKEIAVQYNEDFKKAVAPLINESWSKLVDLSEWVVSDQDTVDEIGKHLKWTLDNNMAFSANIVPVSAKRLQLKRMFVEGGTDSFSDVFETEKAALDWLKEKGF